MIRSYDKSEIEVPIEQSYYLSQLTGIRRLCCGGINMEKVTMIMVCNIDIYANTLSFAYVPSYTSSKVDSPYPSYTQLINCAVVQQVYDQLYPIGQIIGKKLWVCLWTTIDLTFISCIMGFHLCTIKVDYNCIISSILGLRLCTIKVRISHDIDQFNCETQSIQLFFFLSFIYIYV